MADFLKSAASYFSTAATSYASNSSNGGSGESNPMIGLVVNVNSLQLRIKRQIGEGSYIF